MTADSDSKPNVFSTDIEVRWGDLDLFNHVNNVAYFRYLEEARMRWMTEHRLAESGAEALPVMVKAGVTFLKPVLYPSTLRVTTHVTEIGGRSVSLEHKIFDAATPDICYAEGYVKLVWIIPSTGKSTPLPQSVHTALGQ